MQIELKLSKDFERCLNELKDEFGEDFEYINGVHPSQLDYSEFINKFVAKDTLADSSIDPNSNANHKDVRSFMTEKGKSTDKLFCLNKIFMTIKKQWGLRTAKQWLREEFSRGFYLNDAATSSYFAYCWANDFTRLATEGLFFLNKYNNQPPKHLTTYFDDVIEFVSFLSNRQAGAVGMPNVLIWAWYFWKKDCENGYYMKNKKYYLKQQFQKFIFRLNQPFLRIDQSAFTNISIFDRPYLVSLFGGIQFPDGTFAIDHIEDLIVCQKIFMEVVSEIREENMFTYPVLTYSLLYQNGKFVDENFAKWCSNHNMRWNDANFFCNSDVGVLSNCCRLLSSTQKLNAFINSIGGTALSVGSCRVSTINLARIAYESDMDKKKYIKILRDKVLLDCKALSSMRYILKRNIEKGLLPNYQDGAVELDKQFCTIGILGLFEVLDLMGLIDTDDFGNKSYSDEALDFACEILDVINEVKDNFECDFSFNVEAIPGENCAGVLCNADNLLYRDGTKNYTTAEYKFNIDGKKYYLKDHYLCKAKINGQTKEVTVKEAYNNNYDVDLRSVEKYSTTTNNGKKDTRAENLVKLRKIENMQKIDNKHEYFILSNQWIPLMEKVTIQEKCRLGSVLDQKCGGGCIAHINIENRFPTKKAAWDMLNYVASQGVIYFAFTTKINVCADRHAFIGTDTCPKCGKPVADTYSRVVGFYTPVSSYQAIRKHEWDLRKWYDALDKNSWF